MTMSGKMQPETLDVFTYNAFVDRFHAETDRAAAVLAGAYLDSFLENALRNVLATGDHVASMFGAHGFLQSFGNKISMACALGLITAELARDMNLIRKVRNHFAHHIWEATFDLPPVANWCREIRVVDAAVNEEGEPVKDTNPLRLRYLLAVGMSTLLVAHSPKVSDSFRELTTGTRRAPA